MAPSQLELLPLELLSAIAEYALWEDVLSLATTSCHLRQSLARVVFRAVRVTNEDSGEGLLEMSAKYGSYITDLHFIGCVHGEPLDPDEEGEAVAEQDWRKAPLLSPLIRDALSGVLLPNVNAARVAFLANEFDGGDELCFEDEGEVTRCRDLIYTFENVETEADVGPKEARYRWRALMDQVWASLSMNVRIKRLEVPDLVPRRTSTFSTPAWPAFLGRLEQVRLSMWGGNNHAGWCSNTLPGYLDFEGHLDESFFQHLTSVQRLRFGAYSTCPFGTTGGRADVVLPLQPDDLSVLQSLDLSDIFISQGLAEFILSKSDTLRSVVLRNCHASAEVFMGDWATFLERLLGEGVRLSEFVIGYRRSMVHKLAQLALGESPTSPIYHDALGGQDDQDMYSDPVAPVFSYGFVDETYGDFNLDGDEFRLALEKGDDLRAYNALMATVQSD
ncbi:hypothetical protein GQ53DRAFT_151411 [Thozetella sp. PMI_491]|nr:hypothetical protein GQ53DRAFT_151411 [Thozetella sp. PMI_491]